MTKPLAIDLFCGLGGWTDGLLAEGWDVVGFDIERHEYGEHRYPAQLVIQDVLTLHGSQFRQTVAERAAGLSVGVKKPVLDIEPVDRQCGLLGGELVQP